MILRRALLAASGLLWLGAMGALGYRQHLRGSQSSAAAAYLQGILGKDAPALVRKSIWLQDPFGAPAEIGYVETQVQHYGSNDARVSTTMEIRADRLPPFAKAALAEMVGPPEDFEGQLHVTLGRYKGVTRIDAKAFYGDQKAEFWAVRQRDGLKLFSRYQGELKSSYVAYDPNLPFGGGLSPFLGMKNLKTGASWSVTHFNPFTRTSQVTVLTVDGEDTIRYKGKDRKCFVLRAHPASAAGAAGGAASYGPPTASAWVAQAGDGELKEGDLLREETQVLLFKLALVLEDSVTAEELDYHKALYPKLPAKARRGKAGAGPDGKGPPK